MSKRCCAKSCYNSQLKNRMVHYFGFPKNEYYSRKWAVAAGREDLLDKPIQNIIKYYLCSSHFTDDCFQDPPLNSKLKKTQRPVTVAIPTIFVSNIEQFLPGDEESLSCVKQTNITNEATSSQNVISLLKRPHNDEPEPIITQMKCNNSSLEISDMLPIYLEEYDLPNKQIRDVEISLLSNSDHEYEECLDGNEVEEVPIDEVNACSTEYYVATDEDGQNSIEEKIIATEADEFDEFTCRLCANNYYEQQLIFFQDDVQLIDIINSVLSRYVIQPDDYLPQQICIPCLDKVRQCREIINGFETVQQKLMDS